MTIARYYKRSATRQLLDDSTDSQEAAAEISQYAATGDPSFSTNTLHLLEQQAFDLALAFHRDGDAEDLDNLKKLSDLIHKARQTAIRERHAKVQETKCDLRREELALKREALSLSPPSPLGGERARVRGASAPSSLPQSDQFGPYARNWDEIGERVRIGHGISKEEWARRLALHKRPATSSSQGNDPQTSAPSSDRQDACHSAPNFVPETIAPTDSNATPDIVSEDTSSKSNSTIDP